MAEAIENLLVVGEHAGVDHSERNHASTGQRGGIDQVSATKLARVVQPISEYETAFREENASLLAKVPRR